MVYKDLQKRVEYLIKSDNLEEKKGETRSRDGMFADWVSIKIEMLAGITQRMRKARDLKSMEVCYSLMEDWAEKALKEIDEYNDIPYELNKSREWLREALNYFKDGAHSGKLGCEIEYLESIKESNILVDHAMECVEKFRHAYVDYWQNK